MTARTTLAQDEALLLAVLRALGHRETGHGSTRPWMRARLRARVTELGLDDVSYLARLGGDEAERAEAARRVACAMSRFFRGSRVLELLRRRVLPELASRAGTTVRVWSAGAARGEEAFTIAMLWLELEPPPVASIDILASDIRADSLERGRTGRFERASIASVPEASLARWFEPSGRELELRPEVRDRVRFEVHDLERDPWPSGLDLLLLRAVAFTYWGEALQRLALERARDAVRPGGWLALGKREELPEGGDAWFERVETGLSLYRRRG